MQLNNRYNFLASAGQNVDVYVIDSGIRESANDPEFAGRVLLGANTVSGETPSHPDSSDCSTANHGTPVAGLIGGANFGVAKNADLISVRAFDCFNRGDGTDIAAAIQWAIDHATASHSIGHAVISFSLNRLCADGSGEPTTCPPEELAQILAKEQAAMAAGIPVVTGAGDQGFDPCSSPNFAPGAIAVGATDILGLPTQNSNFGACVSVWAPGENIGSASVDPSKTTFTGTSFAAGYVAGAVAVMLGSGQFEGVPAAQLTAKVAAQIKANATLTSNPKASRLLYVPPTLEGSSIAVAKSSPLGKLVAIGVGPDSKMFENNQLNSNSTDWSGWSAPSKHAGWHSVGADAYTDGRTQQLGLSLGTGEVFQRRQLTANSPGLSGWTQLSGHLQSIAAAREQDGLMQLVGVDKDGGAWHATQTSPGANTFTAWQLFTVPNGTELPAFNSIAAEADNQGIVNVFAVDTHGRIWTSRQATVNSAAWFPFVPFATTATGAELLVSEVAVAREGSGRLNVYGITSARVSVTSQATPGSASWSPWAQAVFSATTMHIAAETNENGTVALLGVDNDGAVWHANQQLLDAGSYTNPVPIGGGLRP
ncbi:S8 family serine peptidase [Kribbella sp. NBC_00359]|uniref:S8 family serine peptidase n=1 Tax=Kribbella sp. NBC_00359 TaxID=2975966 RepID=UPI002E1BEEBC